MKQLLLLAILIFQVNLGFAQTQTTLDLMEEIKGEYHLDDYNHLTYEGYFDIPNVSADQLYSRAMDYFTYNYVDGNSVIQSEDKEEGKIVGKGIYRNVHVGFNLLGTVRISTYHILRVDVKDGKARAILTLLYYCVTVIPSKHNSYYYETDFIDEYPINQKGTMKDVMAKALYYSHFRALNSIEKIENALMYGSTFDDVDNESW